MTLFRKTRRQAEFGDFQTPVELCRQVCALLSRRQFRPRSILEPNCGSGNFIAAALEYFPSVEKALGVEINPEYVEAATATLGESRGRAEIKVVQADFFSLDWSGILHMLPDPLLVLGNPPWVTNAALGTMGGSNLPQKSNFAHCRGIEAITGKSNFDISEWMISRELEWIRHRDARLAMLCKTAVARRAFTYAWENGLPLERADLYHVDASRHFRVTVDSCLLVAATGLDRRNSDCRVHPSLDDSHSPQVFGYRGGRLIADAECFERTKHLEGRTPYKWRSGIKHDCSKVMELREAGDRYCNGLSELVDLESEFLYPMLKSAEVANAVRKTPGRWMLVTQRFIGEDTGRIQFQAPKTWDYLMAHAGLLDRRGSAVYRKGPRFSVFGAGDYSFTPWKVAISGMYKKLDFRVIGPFRNRPVVLDDTCYFLACRTKEEAEFLAALLTSDVAREFFSALIFWDAKRPVTATILQSLDLIKVAEQLQWEEKMNTFLCNDSPGFPASVWCAP